MPHEAPPDGLSLAAALAHYAVISVTSQVPLLVLLLLALPPLFSPGFLTGFNSVVFAAAHLVYGSWLTVFLAFAGRLVLAGIYRRYESFWGVWILHLLLGWSCSRWAWADTSSGPFVRDARRGTVGRVAGQRALFLDWGGTLTQLRDNRTVVDADGNPFLMPGVEATLARVWERYAACFIVSNQGRIARGEISEAEVRRRFGWAERAPRPIPSPTGASAPTRTRTAARAGSRDPACSSISPPPTGSPSPTPRTSATPTKTASPRSRRGIKDFQLAADFFAWR